MIVQEKLKGVSPHYEITTPACSQLSALHRARSGSNHARHDHSGYGLHDHDNQAETEGQDRNDDDPGKINRHRIKDRYDFEDCDSGARRQDSFNNWLDIEDRNDPGSGSQDRNDSGSGIVFGNNFDREARLYASFHRQDRCAQGPGRSAAIVR
jgi:hypothetical protein